MELTISKHVQRSSPPLKPPQGGFFLSVEKYECFYSGNKKAGIAGFLSKG
jgi:hypothetical protein